MLRAKEGDESAFAELVKSYQHRLVGVLAHLLGDATTESRARAEALHS